MTNTNGATSATPAVTCALCGRPIEAGQDFARGVEWWESEDGAATTPTPTGDLAHARCVERRPDDREVMS